jgi:hypothetical protein
MTPAKAHPALPRAPESALPRAPASVGRRAARGALALCAVAAVLLAAGCGGTGHPRPIASDELAEAQTFPYYPVYWVGPTFLGHPLAAADGLRNYIEKIGDSVYYGDCVQSKGIFGGGSCLLPLQVTTVIYHLHSNSSLGAQHNIIVRGVPATVYDEGRSIEIYTGRQAIDIFSDDYSDAISAATRLLPLNAPGSPTANLPAPVFCPDLAGVVEGEVSRVMAALPGRACQRAAAQIAYTEAITGRDLDRPLY